MANRQKVIDIAVAEIGYKEKATNSSLDLATANAGSNNWTKYARDLYNAGYYNGNKNGYAWCDCFVDWCFYKAFGKTEGQLMEYQTGTLGAACPYSAGYYKNQGRYDQNPQPGDQVFFQQNGSLVHTGLVIAVSGSTITCVEGNASNMVKKTSYNYKTNSYVAGFGHPNYDDDYKASTSTTTSATTTSTGGTYTMTMKNLKNGSRGDAVKALQILLIGNGFSCGSKGADGIFGYGTMNAVKKYQKEKNLTVDGIVGKNTMSALLGL